MERKGTLLGRGDNTDEIIRGEIRHGVTVKPTRRDYVPDTAISVIRGLNESKFLRFNSTLLLSANPEHINDLFAGFITGVYGLPEYELTLQEFDELKDLVLEALERVREFYVQPQVTNQVRTVLKGNLIKLLKKLEVYSCQSAQFEIEGDLMVYLCEYRTLDHDLEDFEDARVERVARASETQVVEVLGGEVEEEASWISKQVGRFFNWVKN